MRAALLVLASLVPACATTTEVRFHVTSSSYAPSPTDAPVEIFVDRAPAEPFRVVGVILVTPKYDLPRAARLAASTATSLGCDLVTVRRDGEVARQRSRPRVLVASLGGVGGFGDGEPGWGSGGSRGGSGRSHGGASDPDTPIDPRMRKFWCGKYVQPRRDTPRGSGPQRTAA